MPTAQLHMYRLPTVYMEHIKVIHYYTMSLQSIKQISEGILHVVNYKEKL